MADRSGKPNRGVIESASGRAAAVVRTARRPERLLFLEPGQLIEAAPLRDQALAAMATRSPGRRRSADRRGAGGSAGRDHQDS